MIPSKELEAKIVAAIDALGIDKATVAGFWNPAKPAADVVAGDPEATVGVGVVVSLPRAEQFLTPRVTFPVAVVLKVRKAASSDGSALAAAAEAVDALVRSWFADVTVLESALACDAVPRIGGMRMDDGAADYSADDKAWLVTWQFTVDGMLKQ